MWPLRLAQAGIVLAVLAGMFYFAGAKNSFFARIWDYWRYTKVTSVSDYFEYLGFGARFSYGGAAFRTYETYPILGVGLGNYAFYFNQMLPDRPLAIMPEVMRIVTPDAARNRLVVGDKADLRSADLVAGQVNRLVDAFPAEAWGKIRYAHRGARCRIAERDGRLLVRFTEPQEAIAPGQSIVLYSDDTVLGGGIIEEVSHGTD
jgi:hypothetical protein